MHVTKPPPPSPACVLSVVQTSRLRNVDSLASAWAHLPHAGGSGLMGHLSILATCTTARCSGTTRRDPDGELVI